MKKNKSQLLNSLIIMIGAVLVIIAIASKDPEPFYKIGGIVVLMFGLYRATNFFISSEEKRKNSEKDDNNEI